MQAYKKRKNKEKPFQKVQKLLQKILTHHNKNTSPKVKKRFSYACITAVALMFKILWLYSQLKSKYGFNFNT